MAGTASVASTNPPILRSSNLEGAVLTVKVTGVTFAPSLTGDHFVLDPGLPGLSIRSATFVSAETATVALEYKGAGFDEDSLIGVRVEEAALSNPSGKLLTSRVTVRRAPTRFDLAIPWVLAAILTVVAVLSALAVVSEWADLDEVTSSAEAETPADTTTGVTAAPASGANSPATPGVAVTTTQESDDAKANAAVERRLFLGYERFVRAEFLIIIFVGMVGCLFASISGLGALAHYVGNREFDREWVIYYLTRPLMGAGVAIVTHWAIRAGFIGTDATTDLDGPGIGAVAALSGLFARNVLEKLKEQIDVLFGKLTTSAPESTTG